MKTTTTTTNSCAQQEHHFYSHAPANPYSNLLDAEEEADHCVSSQEISAAVDNAAFYATVTATAVASYDAPDHSLSAAAVVAVDS